MTWLDLADERSPIPAYIRRLTYMTKIWGHTACGEDNAPGGVSLIRPKYKELRHTQRIQRR